MYSCFQQIHLNFNKLSYGPISCLTVHNECNCSKYTLMSIILTLQDNNIIIYNILWVWMRHMYSSHVCENNNNNT